MPSVYIKTYGCQMNERDSEAVAAQFVARGYTLAASEAGADVVLLNTCSVRDAAEQRALGRMTNLLRGTRRRRPQVVLGLLGCMAQSRGAELLERLPGLNLVLGTQKFHRAAEHVEALRAEGGVTVCDVGVEAGSEGTIREHLPAHVGRTRAVTAYVSIMQGCNQHCTFCIVPATRGQERSRSLEDIVGECRELAAQGVKEVTLLGQIVTSYGRRGTGVAGGGGDKSAFVRLLEAVGEVSGIERIRFTSPHPKGYGDDLVEAYARLPKLCEHAHVPVQSGSNRVLKLMRRGYTRERYLSLAEKLRRARPGLALGTDLIVGFPGETEADFEETLGLVREVEFDSAYVFKYSPRRHTAAAALPDPVPEAVREERHARLLGLVTEIGARHLQRLVGARVEILVEGPSRKNPARLEGRTGCNRIVVFAGAARHVGQLLDVRISRASAVTLYGDAAILDGD
ncbi:MAG: tRNA (N6-isopentenyl adenosine(37)-C2)-methylthiotransferase MiaB [Verrucomicrobia bacterium]|nr:tRNA (N6-isopentenyl adenosine(37)-C2)-methylthiotransferase MiaB [Verrucomicrobiota bacterium]